MVINEMNAKRKVANNTLKHVHKAIKGDILSGIDIYVASLQLLAMQFQDMSKVEVAVTPRCTMVLLLFLTR